MSRQSSLACAAAFVLTAMVSIAHSEPTATTTPVSPLLTAKTFQVTQTQYQLGHGGKPIPPIRVDIAFAQPGQLRIEQTVCPPGQVEKKLSLFIQDGGTQYEYDCDNNKYIKGDAPPPGEAPRPQLVYSYYQANVDNLLHPDRTREQPGAVTTTATEVDHGMTCTVTTNTYPARKTEEGETVVNWNKTWVDNATGLMLRQAAYYTLNGSEPHEAMRTEFSSWKIDQPIPTATFAWAPPADASVYVEAKLLEPGTPAPDFEAIGADGKTFRLSDFKGKVVLIDFWATWCGPCQAEMPNIERTWQRVKDKDVVVLAICVWDTRPEFDKWMKKNAGSKYNFPFAFDPAADNMKASIAAKLFNVRGIPTQYVIDKDGKVATAYSGWYTVDNRAEEAFFELGVDIPKPEVVTK